MDYVFGSFSRRRQSEEPKGAPKRRSVDVTNVTPSSVILRRTRTLPHVEDSSYICGTCNRQLVEPRVLPCLHTFCTRCLVPLVQLVSKGQSLYHGPDSQSQASLSQVEHAKTSINEPVAGGSINGSGSGGSGYESEPSSWSSENTQGTNQVQIIVCPTCNTENKLSSRGVSNLPLHFLLQNRMLLSLQQATTCDLCTSDSPASSRCQDCQVSLCEFCSEAHQRQRASALHEIISLQETSDAALVRRQVMCEAHPSRELRLFCARCGVVVCRDCCVLLHRGHPCDTAARAARNYAASLREALDKTRPLAKEAALSLNRLQQLELRIQTRCNEVDAEVERFAESYKLALEEHRMALHREVNQVRHNKMATLHAHHADLQARSEHTGHAVAFGQELLAEASDIELLSLVSPLLKRLEWCNASEVVAAIKVSDCLQFLPDERAGGIRSHTMFGVITTQAIAPQYCSLQTEGLLNCRQHKKAEFLLSTHDCDKQPICHGGAQITTELRYRDGTHRQIPVQVLDQGDGTYLLSFVPDAAGNLILNVTILHKHIQGSPFNVSVSTLRPHPGVYHCCTFCSSNGSKDAICGCGGRMAGGYKGCGHGHTGHPGRRHWSCCGNLLHNSECSRAPTFQFTL